jgi:hypothetical protein
MAKPQALKNSLLHSALILSRAVATRRREPKDRTWGGMQDGEAVELGELTSA